MTGVAWTQPMLRNDKDAGTTESQRSAITAMPAACASSAVNGGGKATNALLRYSSTWWKSYWISSRQMIHSLFFLKMTWTRRF